MKGKEFLKKGSLTCFAFLFLAGCSAFSGGGKAGPTDKNGTEHRWSPESLVREKVTFTPKAPEHWQLPNGIEVYYQLDDEIPTVRGTFYIPGGSLVSGMYPKGVTAAVGEMLRDGGFQGMSPDALDKSLDDLAAVLESTYGQTYGTVACSSLKEDFPKVFGYASEIIRHPAFDQKRFELWKRDYEQSIDRRKDNPGTIASMVLGQQVYGKDTIYGSILTRADVDKLTIEDLKKYHAKYIQPKGTYLVVNGDITKDELNKILEDTVAKWAPSPQAVSPQPLEPVPGLGQPGIYVIERDFDQSTVLMGHIGPPLPNPEIPEMGVFNRLYGSGGFSNVLMQEIRTKLGLAYGVGGSISPGIGAGLFEIELATRNDEVVPAIKKVLEVTEKTLKEPPTSTDLESAKSAVERAFIFKFETPDQVTNRAVQQLLLQFPPDYDAKYLPKIEALTPGAVFDVGKRWVKPDHLNIVVVGRVSAEKIKEAFADTGIPVYKVTFDEQPHIVGEVGK